MEDALKAAFESQFGTEWSTPVVAPGKNSEDSDDDFHGFESDSASDSASDSRAANSDSSDTSEPDEPVTVKHSETPGGSAEQSLPQLTKARKRRFLNNGGAPKDDTIELKKNEPKTDEERLDLQNDLELQRLIEESHILHERPKGQEFTGADISGVGDPMELIGQNRLKIMQARLARAGAKQTKQRMPQAMAVGLRNKALERQMKQKQEAKEAGIVLARERHERSKGFRRDTGLRINAIGRASEHGIHISAADRERVRKQAHASKPRNKRRK